MIETYFMGGVMIGGGAVFMILAIIASKLMYKKALVELEIAKVQKEIELMKVRDVLFGRNK